MYAYMYACTYLFNSVKERFPKKTREQAICPGLDVPRHAWWFQGTGASCRFRLQRNSLDPLSVRGASRGKQQRSPNADVWQWALAICRPVVHAVTSPQQEGPQKNPMASAQDALKPGA